MQESWLTCPILDAQHSLDPDTTSSLYSHFESQELASTRRAFNDISRCLSDAYKTLAEEDCNYFATMRAEVKLADLYYIGEYPQLAMLKRLPSP